MDKELFDFIKNSNIFLNCTDNGTIVRITYDITYATFRSSNFNYETILNYCTNPLYDGDIKNMLVPILERYNTTILRERNIDELL